MAVVGEALFEGLFLDSVKEEGAEEDPVAVLEDYFKFRYTEHDHEYMKCRNRRKMMYQVPVISPWPPPLVRNRRPRGNRYKERRHGEKERYGSERSHHRSLVSSHERYNDWSPPRYHGSYRYRSNSPGSPQHSPPISHLSRSYDHDQFKSSQEDERLSSQEQHQREKEDQPLAVRPQQREEEKDTESKPAPAFSNYLDSLMLNMRESPEKLTDSDVQALLINAGSASSKPVLPLKRQKKEKKEPSQPIKKQQPEEKPSTTESSTAKRKVQPDGLLVSHGNTKSVTASILRDGLSANKTMALPQRNKKKRMRRVLNNISDEEEDEIIDPVQVNNDTMQLSTRLRQEATDGVTGVKVKMEEGQPALKSAFYNQPEAFTVHINLKHVNLNSKTESFNNSETQPVSPTGSPSTSCMYSSAVTLDDSNKHVVLRLSKPVESETDVLSAKKSHKSKKKKKSKEHSG